MLAYFWGMYSKHHEYLSCFDAVLHGINAVHPVCWKQIEFSCALLELRIPMEAFCRPTSTYCFVLCET